MNFLGFLWIASYIGSFFSPYSFFKAPDELFRVLSDKAFAVVSNSISYPSVNQTPNRTVSSPDAARPWSALLNLKTNLNGGIESLRSNSPRPGSHSSWWNVGGYSLVRPGGDSQPAIAMAAPSHTSNWVIAQGSRGASRIAMQDSTKSDRAESDSSRKILQVLNNLPNLPQVVRQNLWAGVPSVTVMRAGRYSSANTASAAAQSASQCDASQSSAASNQPNSETVFQIRVKGHLVAEVPSQTHASQIANQIRQALQDRDLSPSAVRPAVIDSQPGAKAEGEVLFVVNDQLADDINHDSKQLAISWVNNLRTALGGETLSVTETRDYLMGLVETEQTFGGLASWYGPYFHGRITATGEVFNQHDLTAAHRTLPFDTFVKVTNLRNGKSVVVRINDRGPYIEGRSLDLSMQAARCIQSESSGVVPYEAVILKPIPSEPPAEASNTSASSELARS
ncbi:septal ring lytic transglycosylase RlpA family protein [Leptolyngbya sp. FACHB-671]|uniref:septal ring lytic transglycosylase RlpA family protein n=1 Tax=Leptolyngbya sp. FACHB-671 TaxID=2692812 RepID=UPI001F553F0D|nr:septal ring lytic transglycosylase RlpA family protein [Leptolyngbya sp. FACHB-671]